MMDLKSGSWEREQESSVIIAYKLYTEYGTWKERAS